MAMSTLHNCLSICCTAHIASCKHHLVREPERIAARTHQNRETIMAAAHHLGKEGRRAVPKQIGMQSQLTQNIDSWNLTPPRRLSKHAQPTIAIVVERKSKNWATKSSIPRPHQAVCFRFSMAPSVSFAGGPLLWVSRASKIDFWAAEFRVWGTIVQEEIDGRAVAQKDEISKSKKHTAKTDEENSMMPALPHVCP